ncbi:PAS domain S-box protein [Caulobacter sp. KR2-114]|uniref:PAS domain-containing protein n=1 Tax=Caulobacter sp. KR2-114 TaxID=3400912 RepID=UPI003C00B6E0
MNDTQPDVREASFHETVLNGLPEAVLVTTADGTIVFANAAASSLFHYPAAELVDQPLTLLTPPTPGRRANIVEWLARWAAAPDVEQSRYLDITARRKDGGELTVEVRVRAGDVHGQRRYFISVRDNTVRRYEQLALKDANLRAARILMVAADAIVSIDAAQKIILFNPAAEQMFGYRVDEVMGQDLAMLIPRPSRAVHGAKVESFRRSKTASRMMSERSEVLGRRRNGDVFPVEATITKVMAGGQLTFTAHLRDVTERNRARDRLIESERRIRAVFDHSTEAIALLAPDGAILEINRAGAALTSANGPLVGAPLWEAPWLGAAVAAGSAEAGQLMAAVLAAAGGAPQRLSASLVRDGRPLPIQVRLTPIPGGEGRVDYVLAEGVFEPAA